MSKSIDVKSQLRLWFLVPLIAFIGGIVMFYFSLGKKTEVTINTSLNRPVPSFQLPILSDINKIVDNDQLPNYPYLINVWGSWCPTCVVEHPFLMSLQKQGVKMVGVNYKDELADAQRYLENYGDPFLFSVQDYSGDMAIDLGLTGAPETFLVDSVGNIRQHIIGEVNQDNWVTQIAPCMAVLNTLSAQQTAAKNVNSLADNSANSPAQVLDIESSISEVCL